MNEQVKLRVFKDSDSGLIYSSWPKGVYYSGIHPITIEKNLWFKQSYRYVQDSLAHDHILIACLVSDPEIILGYAVFKGTTLEWVYVKKDYRHRGIARLLMGTGIERININHLTHLGKALLPKLKLETE